MAPVYALMISFGIVAVSGALVSQSAPETPPQPATAPPAATAKSPKIRFLTPENQPALTVAGANILVGGASVGRVDARGEFSWPANVKPSAFCARLGSDLSSPEAVSLKDGITCWKPDSPNKDVVVHVEELN